MKTIKLFLVKIFSFLINDLKNEIKNLESSVKELNEKMTPENVVLLKDPSLVLSPDGRFKIRIERHPNKDVETFHVSLPLFSEGSYIHSFNFPQVEDKMSPESKKLIAMIYETNQCVSGFLNPFSLSFTKSGASNWNEIHQKVIEIIFNFLSEKYPAPESEPVSEEKEIQMNEFESKEDFTLNHLSFPEEGIVGSPK